MKWVVASNRRTTTAIDAEIAVEDSVTASWAGPDEGELMRLEENPADGADREEDFADG